jgi:ATP-dependent DNA helicase RecG
LGLAIIDEQHKFGVVQRGLLKKKGENPDVLVMTATPIPRTLAMTIYGDLDVSLIDEMPPGRMPVETKVFPESARGRVYRIVEEEVRKGRQAFTNGRSPSKGYLSGVSDWPAPRQNEERRERGHHDGV